MINKRIIAMSFVFIIGQFAFSQTEDNMSYADGDVMRLELPDNFYASEAVNILNHVQLLHDTTYKIAETPVADECVAFMNKDQILGPLGSSIYKRVVSNNKDYPFLLRGGDINNICPRYGRMSEKQKGLVWVLVLTMVAHFESSCKLGAYAKGPNGTAQGLYQLHKGKEIEYTDNKNACPKNASLNASQSSTCMLAMLDDQMEKMNGKLFAPKSYWDVLRPQGRSKRAKQIAATLKRSSLCSSASL
ncbi:MAG: hypothetical protein H7256_02340 [Bdellovibrio sp.]|nr:hypothetical protein [Bdellovibrio sp.]